MKKIVLILFAFLIYPQFLISQNFPIFLNDTVGGTLNWAEIPESIIETPDFNYIYCGTKYSQVNFSGITLNKITQEGLFVWSKEYYYGEGVEVINCLDGGYVILGEVEGSSSQDDDIVIIKTDENGNELWNKTYGIVGGDEDPRAILETNDGGYIICSDYKINMSAADDVNILKLDYLGNLEWSQNYGNGSLLNARTTSSIQQTLDGGYVFSVNDSIVKINSFGQLIWKAGYGINLTYDGDIKVDDNGDFIICGQQIDPQNNFSYNICLIKTNSLGNEIWRKYFGGTEDEYCAELHITSDDGIVLFAETEINGDEEIYVVKTDAFGNQQWDFTWGFLGEDFSKSGLQMFNGQYIVCGILEDFGSGIIIRIDGNGNITSLFNLPSNNLNRKLEKVVDILGRDINLQKNKPFIEIYNDGTVEKRIIIE